MKQWTVVSGRKPRKQDEILSPQQKMATIPPESILYTRDAIPNFEPIPKRLLVNGQNPWSAPYLQEKSLSLALETSDQRLGLEAIEKPFQN